MSEYNWTKSKSDYLEANALTKTASEIGEVLYISAASVRGRARRMGIECKREKVSAAENPILWTPERKAPAARLWREDGLSANEIAKILRGVTRNAVIGLLHRMGVAGRDTPARPKAAARPPKPQRLAHSTRKTIPPPRLILVNEPVPIIPADILTTTMMDLNTRTQCGWHLGGDNWCAERKAIGSVFCPTHRVVGVTSAPKPISTYRDAPPSHRARISGSAALRAWGDE